LKFPQKLTLAIALGLLPENARPAFQFINKLRNDFAHDLNTELSEEVLTDFWNVLTSEMKETVKTGTDTASLTLKQKLAHYLVAMHIELYHRVAKFEE